MIRRLPIGIAAGLMGGGKKADTTPWYLAGGIPIANCIAAYQAIGAADAASSYVNLVTPGTFDLTTTAAPSFATATGWDFSETTMWLESGLTWNTANSVIALIADGGATAPTDRYVFASGNFQIIRGSGTNHYYRNGGGYLTKAGIITTKSVMAISNDDAYLDGVSEGDLPTGALTVTPIYIGNNSSKTRSLIGKLLAISFYNVVLTEAQIQTIGTAMQALPNP